MSSGADGLVRSASPESSTIEPPSDTGGLAASVVVLAYNAAGTIERCLDSLARQTCSEPYEVIVVWSGDPATRKIVAARFPGIRLVGRPDRILTGEARNLGIASATGEVIAFLAADCLAAPDWLARRLAGHREGFRCVGGAVLCAQPAGPLARANHLVEYAQFSPLRPREIVVGTPIYNLSFRREIFEEFGRYAPELACGEDTLFNLRLARTGEPALFDPSIHIYHPGPERFREFFRHHVSHGRAYGTLYRRSDYPGARECRVATMVRILLFYPLHRLTRLLQRAAVWQQADRKALVTLAPFILLGIGAATLGVARGWLQREAAV